jgi:SepF-like predicted cell division protein (DUF552 family)
MPSYEFWYDETNTFKAWFEADNLEQAKELVSKVQDGELDITDLPEFQNKDKNYELLIDHLTELTDV